MSIIKLGPVSITDLFEEFYEKRKNGFDFSGFFSELNLKPEGEVSIFISSPHFPTLFISANRKGIYLFGLAPNTNFSSKSFFFKELELTDFFEGLYLKTFSPYSNILFAPNKIKVHFGIFTQEAPVSAFALAGDESEVKKILKSEEFSGKPKLSCAGFFSETAFIKVLNSYERWGEEGWRFDFSRDNAIISIDAGKNKFSGNEFSERKLISFFLISIMKTRYPELIEYSKAKISKPGFTNSLISFSVPFAKFNSWLSKLEIFSCSFSKISEKLYEFIDEEFRKDMEIFK